MCALVPEIKISLNQSMGGLANDDGIRFRQALYPGGNIRGLSNHCLQLELFPGGHIASYHQTGMNSQSYSQLYTPLFFERRIQILDRLYNPQPGAHCPMSVILMC